MTPYWAEAVTGFALGGLYALVGLGVTQIYKVTRVFNFAHAGFILWGAYIYSEATYMWHLPVGLALAITLAIVAAMGVATELLIFKFAQRSTASSKIILTFGLLELLSSAAFWIFGGNPRGSVPLVTTVSVPLFGTRIGENQIAQLIAAAVIVALMAVFLRFTRLGLLTRAVAEDAAMAEILGARPTLVGSISWAIATTIAAVAGVFIASAGPITMDLFYAFFITSLVAVVVGGMQSLALTVIGGLLLGVASNEITATQFTLGPLCIFGVLVLLVIFRRSWPADLAPPRSARGVITRDESKTWSVSSAFAVIFIGGWAAIAVVAHNSNVWGVTVDLALFYSLACLSLVPILRWTGQVSLAQAGFMGIGASAMASFNLHDHMPLVVAMLLGSLVAAAFGGALGFIVRRISFVLAAVMTLEFMNIAGLFEAGKYAPWISSFGFGGIELQPPAYVDTWDRLGIGLVVVALAVIFGLRNLQNSSLGTRLLAARVSPVMARHFGVRPALTRIYAYMVSAFIAGLAGSAYLVLLTDASPGIFNSNLSLYVLIYAVVGGVGALWGPFIGALLFIGFPELIGLNRFGSSPFPLMIQGALLIVLCAVSLDGLVGLGRHPSSKLPSQRLARALVMRVAPRVNDSVNALNAIGSARVELAPQHVEPAGAMATSDAARDN